MHDIDLLNKMGPYGGNMRLGEWIRLSFLGYMAGFMQRFSKIYYVNPSTGSDTNAGLRFDAPFKTIAAAISAVVSGQNNVILIQASPGTNITETDIDIAKSDLAIIGLNDPTLRSVIIKPTTDPTTAIFKIAADRVQFLNLRIDGAGDGGKDLIAFNVIGGANNVYMKNIHMDLCKIGINTTNVASCSNWVLEDLLMTNFSGGTGSAGILGYLHEAKIIRPVIIRGQGGNDNALVSGISLLDNTTTADSDNVTIYHPLVNGAGDGINKIITNGILIDNACEGVTVLEPRCINCTDNIAMGTGARNLIIYGKTNAGGQGGAAYVNTNDNLTS